VKWLPLPLPDLIAPLILYGVSVLLTLLLSKVKGLRRIVV